MTINQINHLNLGQKNWVEINYDSHGVYSTGSQIRFKTMMLKSSLCDYRDACILVSGNVKLTGEGADDAAKQTDERDKEVIFKIFVPFTKCKSEINNAQVDDAKEIDVVTPRYNLIEYSDNHSILNHIWKRMAILQR